MHQTFASCQLAWSIIPVSFLDLKPKSNIAELLELPNCSGGRGCHDVSYRTAVRSTPIDRQYYV